MTGIKKKSGYSEVNGLSMYYEIYGEGKPLVLIHGGGSTIQTTFGNLIPWLLPNRQIIAMDLQAHGRTADRNTPLSFARDADDIAALLRNLGITKAAFLGYSNGGQTLFEVALRYPLLVEKMIVASAFYKREAAVPQFWEGFSTATLSTMPKALQEGFLKVNPDKSALLNMFNRDVERMKAFTGWSDEQIQSITASALIINGNNDVGSIEHAVEMYRAMSNSQLLILPGKHGSYIGAGESLETGEWSQHYIADILNEFLNE